MTHRLSDRALRMADTIAAWPQQRVPLTELWRILDDADPTTGTLIDRRRVLADTLQELVDAQIVALPTARSYDHSEHPALPRFVMTGVRRDRAPRQRPSVLWHPSLAWAAVDRLTPTQYAALERINTWLFRAGGGETVPLRERSIEILGDEKALDRLILGGLFASDRLTLEMLRSRRVAPPLHTVRVGGGERLLVIENSDTFDSVSRHLARSPGAVGLVGWGAGAAFEASILSVAELRPEITRIVYFGDLDARGLQIPAGAARIAASVGLPPVEPAIGLYAALMQVGVPAPAKTATSAETAQTLAAWLAADHRSWAQHLLTTRQRVAQEWVGTTFLGQGTLWREGLV